jgi:hypothetical protein
VRIVGILATLLFGALLGCLGTLNVTGHFWWRSEKYKFTSNGVPGKALYVGKEVWLVSPGTGSSDSYVVYPLRQVVGVAENRRFVHLPGCVLSLDIPATYIPIAKFEVPVQVYFGPGKIAFQGVNGEEVVIDW